MLSPETEALKSLLVLPRTPDPEDSPTHDIDIDNLTKAQKAQVKAFMRGLVVNLARNKSVEALSLTESFF